MLCFVIVIVIVFGGLLCIKSMHVTHKQQTPFVPLNLTKLCVRITSLIDYQ